MNDYFRLLFTYIITHKIYHIFIIGFKKCWNVAIFFFLLGSTFQIICVLANRVPLVPVPTPITYIGILQKIY